MIINRVYGSATTKIPIIINYKKSPKLAFLDTGLVNYRLGFRENILHAPDLAAAFLGQIAEQIVAQSLYSFTATREPVVVYWYRASKGATAEVDYLYCFRNKLVLLEVKSGKIGTLKSLHRFMMESGQKLAVRIYSGSLNIQMITLPNDTTYTLLSLPFYLLFRLDELIAECFVE